jgi:hypothetical protein
VFYFHWLHSPHLTYTHKHTSTQTHKHTNTQAHKHTNTQTNKIMLFFILKKEKERKILTTFTQSRWKGSPKCKLHSTWVNRFRTICFSTFFQGCTVELKLNAWVTPQALHPNYQITNTGRQICDAKHLLYTCVRVRYTQYSNLNTLVQFFARITIKLTLRALFPTSEPRRGVVQHQATSRCKDESPCASDFAKTFATRSSTTLLYRSIGEIAGWSTAFRRTFWLVGCVLTRIIF